jgi:N-ethylmaleimide reductase
MLRTLKNSLFTSFDLSGRPLRNRIVMASMTRGRARNAELVPTDLHVEYYRQRASAGLIVSEAIWVSQEAIGFINVPGLFTSAQVEGWRAVTDAVHAQGGVIYAQLAHSGAVSHPDFFDGAQPLAPSSINPGLRSFTVQGFKETVTPRAMTIKDIRRTVEDYRAAAKNARAAGFDGVEVHAGTTYLLPQFLNSALNVRKDEYGGSAENRARIVIEILEKLTGDWEAGRVGIKISPTVAMGGFAPTEQTVATYDYLVGCLDRLPLSHLQVVKATNDLTGTPVAALQDTIGYVRARFNGTLVANLGFDRASANSAIENDQADLVSFGRAFIGNPDLVRRLREDLPLNNSDQGTYYQGGKEGYIDYLSVA